jgi:hypothetical protein
MPPDYPQRDSWDPAYPRQPRWIPIPSGHRLMMRRRAQIIGASIGVTAVTLSIFVATITAAFLRVQASPLVDMSRIYIVAIPAQFRGSAGYYLGSSTQPLILLSMFVVIEFLAGVVGILTMRRKVLGLMGFVLCAALASGAILLTPGSRPADLLPTTLGGLAGTATLHLLSRRVRPSATAAGFRPRTW